MLWASAKSSALCLRTSLFSARSILLPAGQRAVVCHRVSEEKSQKRQTSGGWGRQQQKGVPVSVVHVWDGWRRRQTRSYLFQTIRAAAVRRDGFQRFHTIKWRQRQTWTCLWNIFRQSQVEGMMGCYCFMVDYFSDFWHLIQATDACVEAKKDNVFYIK